MLRCMSPDVAQSRRAEGQPRCRLLGVTRTSPSPWGRRDLCRRWCGPANSRTCSGLVPDGAARGATTTAQTPSSAAGVVLERKSIMVSSLISILQIREHSDFSQSIICSISAVSCADRFGSSVLENPIGRCRRRLRVRRYRDVRHLSG